MTWDEATYREILADISTESDHLEVLVTDLIEMSRIEMGALVFGKRVVRYPRSFVWGYGAFGRTCG